MLRILFLLLTVLLLPLPAHAVIITANSSPSTKNVGADAPASFPVIWSTVSAPAASYTVRSEEARVRLGNAGGPVIAVLPRRIAVNINGTNATLRENVTLSRDLIRRGQDAGGLYYERIFTDGIQTEDAGVQISIISAATADFGISSIDLNFDDGSVVQVVEPGTSVTALARLGFTGNGRVQAAWQVRPVDGGAFRTLRVVQAQSLGGQALTLRSPQLPTSRDGEQLEVRLHLLKPEAGFVEPVITLGITGGGLTPLPLQRVAGEVKVLSPAVFSPLNGGTQISWEASERARAYRIEVLPAGGGRTPLAIQMARKDSTSATLSALSLSKLAPEGRYIIRVIAVE